jgi:UTP--glucose-1-phosphate uridylyltransferase
MIDDDIRQNGEFQLTYAQELQRKYEGYCAFEITSGRRFDFGIPQDFVDSVAAFAAG